MKSGRELGVWAGQDDSRRGGGVPLINSRRAWLHQEAAMLRGARGLAAEGGFRATTTFRDFSAADSGGGSWPFLLMLQLFFAGAGQS